MMVTSRMHFLFLSVLLWANVISLAKVWKVSDDNSVSKTVNHPSKKQMTQVMKERIEKAKNHREATNRILTATNAEFPIDDHPRLQGAGGGAVSSDGDNEKKGASCFAGTETLLLESGESIAIKDVQVGDRVQVVSRYGALDFADVIYIPHKENNERVTFTNIDTKDGSLTLTPDHLILAGICGESMDLIRADDVDIGSCIATTTGQTKITSSTTLKAQGIYTVVTSHSDGMIVVNGFKVSSFAINHFMGNTYYQIHRALHATFPSMVESLRGLGFLIESIVSVSI